MTFVDVFVALGKARRAFGPYRGRTELQEDGAGDASLIIRNVTLQDYGRYECEVTNELEDDTGVVKLDLEGARGRSRPAGPGIRAARAPENPLFFTELFRMLRRASLTSSPKITLAAPQRCHPSTPPASPNPSEGLHGAPIHPLHPPKSPRGAAERSPRPSPPPGGFPFSRSFHPAAGKVYFLKTFRKLSYPEAVQACKNNGAAVAKVGQLYAAWKIQLLDRCEAGWLADGSIRYPIVNPRARCGGREPGVRNLGFPDKKYKLFGVYCFKKAGGNPPGADAGLPKRV
ncbi:Hyaluronan and proteoglycan link protein 4 [Lonchura striata]|uniref:Hyaluronan and proteoglycan link protein 4 n=1 Tax=Lonchura striata TaxID=40157 RepID=A0A218UC32_9PASE|nr:Hyaluronan and proteoglycan link protein 4 [Lonchura striata domestica]